MGAISGQLEQPVGQVVGASDGGKKWGQSIRQSDSGETTGGAKQWGNYQGAVSTGGVVNEQRTGSGGQWWGKCVGQRSNGCLLINHPRAGAWEQRALAGHDAPFSGALHPRRALSRSAARPR